MFDKLPLEGCRLTFTSRHYFCHPFIFLFTEPVVILPTKPSVWVEEHQNVTLTCNVTGQPFPTVTWSKAGKKLNSNSKTSGEKLTLFHVTPHKDNGTYTCKAKNLMNEDEIDTKVTVVPFLRFTINPPVNISVLVGSDIYLNCQGTRFSNVTWQREGGDLPATCLVHPNGTLVLLNVSKSFSGSYVCTVKTTFRFINATSLVKIYHPESTCSHLKDARPSAVSGNYVIDPDGEGGEDPFTVYCNMIDRDGIGVTVVGHNRETREHVTGCDPPGCFKRNVIYTGVTISQLAGLTRVNSNCEQFIVFECHNDVAFVEDLHAWWVSREGKAMYYWGGADPGSGKCACGMNGTCVSGGGCNCKNVVYRGWRSDSGLLSEKSSLPVIQLRFGDVESSQEEGYYSLGKFKCYGLVK